ncbi:MAG: 16S rRNA processing protein RimM [Acidobacteriia bacterium]|nr:16S rRNA processing protein RimM [Terriglobia bacterium]
MNSGAPSKPDTEWVTIAVLGRTRGNSGEITALPLSSKPERFESLNEVYLFGSGDCYRVETTWFHQDTLIFKFAGIDTISDAEKLRGAEVRLPISERTPLPPGEYFQSDLIGCRVVERGTARPLGTVADWDDGGGSGLLVLDDGTLIPFARSICVEIDSREKLIAVDLPAGLKELNQQ